MPNLSTIQTFDIALRGGEVLLLLFIAALLLRDYGRIAAARFGAAFAVGAAAFAVSSAPGFADAPLVWRMPMLALATGNAVVFWLFARALFDDAVETRPWHVALWAAFAAGGIANCLGLAHAEAGVARASVVALSIGTLAFNVLAVVQSLASWRTDLVENRRKLRGLIVGSAAAYTVVQTIARLAFPGESAAAIGSVINITAQVAVTVPIAWQMLGASTRDLFSAGAAGTPQPQPPPDEDVGAEPHARAPEPVDASVVEAIEQAVLAGRAYREPNLTIGALANRLGLAEYKLRRAINRGRGYRNFNVFLNEYRIRDAKNMLTDPAKSEISIIQIAMECGFQSLGPFNRAFKAGTGLTPTEFRRQHIGKPAARAVLQS